MRHHIFYSQQGTLSRQVLLYCILLDGYIHFVAHYIRLYSIVAAEKRSGRRSRKSTNYSEVPDLPALDDEAIEESEVFKPSTGKSGLGYKA